MAIKAITFDFWSTLYRNRVVNRERRLKQLREAVEQSSGISLDLEEFEAAVKLAWESWNRTWLTEYRTITAEEWLLIALKTLDLSLETEALARIRASVENNTLVDRPVLVEEAAETLAVLASYYRLAIISDTGLTPGRVLRQILEEDNLLHLFTQLTFSNEVGYSKPHQAAFLTTLEALDVRPEEAVHVGDLLRTDIAGAQQVGMRAVQYIGVHLDDGAQGERGVSISPDAVIGSHNELEALIRAWNGRSP